MEIANAGNQKALYLTLKVLPSSPIIETSPSMVYIGNLDSDDYDSEEISFKVKDDASPGTYPLKIQLTYKDLYGQGYNETYNVDILVSSLNELGSNGKGSSIITIVIVLVVLGVVAYFIYRKFFRKKKK